MMASLADLKSTTLRLANNLCGWKTRRKLLVIESDDWGAIRMPSPKAYQELLRAGIRVDRSPYDRLDCLENGDDFQALMNVIDAHRDASGQPPTFTFNTVMGNPNFGAIQRDDFQRYHHQHFFESYRHYHDEDLSSDWQAAMEARLIRPQFHAREHLNVPLWMADLKAGREEARLGFRHGFYGMRTTTSSRWQQHYKAAHCAESPQQMEEIAQITSEGLTSFRQTFNFSSDTFVACNYVLPDELEKHLESEGVCQIQTQRGYVQPLPAQGGKRRIRHPYTGQSNKHGQRYSVRNVFFEPYSSQQVDWVGRAFGEVRDAFRLHTPAIVCSHRINYTSGMEKAHRDRSLKMLDRFLGRLRYSWPEIEFVSSDELAATIRG